MPLTLKLPRADRTLADYTLQGSPLPAVAALQPDQLNRIAYSAVHVVADPLADNDPWSQSAIDWDATIAYRRYLWSLGLGVAEAMDTAQRGMGLDWPTAKELIARSIDAARDHRGALLASGAGTDQLDPAAAKSLDDVIRAYEEQVSAIEKMGGRIVLMASRALARRARGAEDYHKVYGRILSQVKQPLILHWLGDMFDPALAGYWGSADDTEAMNTALQVIEDNRGKIDGIKISLLSKEKEIAMRRRLPEGVRMYTGDDFNFAELIAGDAQGYSDALLGVFDAIAPVAAAALRHLAKGDMDAYRRCLDPTVPLGRHIFKAPTQYYKTGVVFLAYLNGHQNHFSLIGGQQSARSLLHLAELFRLADQARALIKPDEAVARMQAFLRTYGLQ